MAFGGGGSIGEVFVTVRARTDQFTSQAKRGILGGLKGTGAQAGQSFSKEFSGAAKVVAGAAIIGFLKGSVDAASDLNETVSKTKVVFGKAAPAVLNFAKGAASSLGLSEQAAGEAAATFGNLFVSMKIGQQPAADMSVTLVKLAGDLASFNNASPEEALEALRSGLVGETEPLRRFGINLNDAALREEALRLGLVKSAKQVLPAAAKAQASYSLILKQSKTAQGDFARTSGGLANQQRIVAAEFKNTQAQLGKQLLPTMLTAERAANKLLSGFNRLDTATGGFASKALLGGVAAAALGVGVGKVVGVVRAARAAWLAYRTAQVAAAAASTLLARQQVALGLSTTTSSAAATVAAGRWATLGKTLGLAGIALTLAANANDLNAKSQSLGARIHATTVAPIYQKLGIYSAARVRQLQAETSGTKGVAAATNQNAAAAGKYAAPAVAAAAATAKIAEASKKARAEFVKQRSAIAGVIPIFEGYQRESGITKDKILGNLRQEVGAYKNWASNAQRLLKRGADPAVVKALSDKGPQYVAAFVNASDRELKDLNRIFKGRTQAAGSVAKATAATAGAAIGQAAANAVERNFHPILQPRILPPAKGSRGPRGSKLAFAGGGLLPDEPFIGIGTRTGQLITLNERGRERVIPAGESEGGTRITQNFTLVQQPGQSAPAFVQQAMFAARTQLRPAG